MSKRNSTLTAERIRELLHYDPETGVFTWRRRADSRFDRWVNRVVGYPDKDGYLTIRIGGKNYFLHRLAWLHAYGIWPTGQIDHINASKTNNKLANLRDVTQSVNMQNRQRALANSKSGVLGVSWKQGRWRAQIKIEGKVFHIGHFTSIDDASIAYLDAKRKLHRGAIVL